MCILCGHKDETIQIIENSLDCSSCSTITSAELSNPNLIQLILLNCHVCINLDSIPDTLVDLETLFCSKCPLITTIPDTLVQLRSLYCYESNVLKAIPKSNKILLS